MHWNGTESTLMISAYIWDPLFSLELELLNQWNENYVLTIDNDDNSEDFVTAIDTRVWNIHEFPAGKFNLSPWTMTTYNLPVQIAHRIEYSAKVLLKILMPNIQFWDIYLELLKKSGKSTIKTNFSNPFLNCPVLHHQISWVQVFLQKRIIYKRTIYHRL